MLRMSLQEAARSGSSDSTDVAFLDTSRSVLSQGNLSQNYSGVYSIAYDALTLAREGANQLSDKYHHNYPDEIMLPLSKSIVELENAISEMQKLNSQGKNPNLLEQKKLSRKTYDTKREDLKFHLDSLEIKAIENLNNANKALKVKWQELKPPKNSRLWLIIASIVYLGLVVTLAFLTYSSFARPISRLEQAASEYEKNQPFNRQKWTNEIRSLTRRLQGLVWA